IADLSAPAPPIVGQQVSIADANGATGSVTVTAVEDPFQGYDPASPPEAGARFVLLTLVYDNPGGSRFDVEPYGLVLRDAQGRLWSPAGISRPSDRVVVPDLTSRQLAPGDRISGAIGFAVPEGIAIDALYWQPSGDRLIELANFAPGAATPGAQATSAIPPVGAAASPVADACADMSGWLAATRGRIREAGAMSMQDATLSDPASLAAHQHAYADLAHAQIKELAPPAAAAVNHALIATLQAYSQSVQSLAMATASSADPDVDITDAVNTFNAAGERLSAIDRQLPTVAAACGMS
ncbi:MAG TPA: DUF4352 domain-containing protein, partial [Thermomicrobiales bacterium]|nr:DUF4352 domain-containing protein [Thermomicrobiales bacterium]